MGVEVAILVVVAMLIAGAKLQQDYRELQFRRTCEKWGREQRRRREREAMCGGTK